MREIGKVVGNLLFVTALHPDLVALSGRDETDYRH